jgi:hypothetical protein
MARPRKKPIPPPPEPDHVWREPVRPDYTSIERRRVQEQIEERRAAMLANFRKDFNRYA